jgi:SAM-dependent methyltransferase
MTPVLFDRALLRARLVRAQAAGAADFLLTRAVEDICDRLSTIKRDFTRVLDLGTPGPHLAQALTTPGRTVWRTAPRPALVGAGSFIPVVSDEEALPFAGESFDLIVSALSLQHVNDLPGLLAQARRCLKPDGLFLAALIGGQTLSELRVALAQAEVEVSGGASPRVAPFADVRDLGGLLQRAGFALPVADTDVLSVRYGHPFRLFADLRAMGATNALTQRSRKPTPRRLMLRAAEIYAERFADSDGRVRATFEILFMSGWAPHESQQKPLKPGSARMRLEDALKAARKD